MLDNYNNPVNIGDRILFKGYLFGIVTVIKDKKIFFQPLDAKTKLPDHKWGMYKISSTIQPNKIIVLKYLMEE